MFHQSFPDKFIVGSETASTLSSTGCLSHSQSRPASAFAASANAGRGTGRRQVSSYDLYFASWSYSPEKEFAAQDRYPFVGGEFVWTGLGLSG